MLVIVAPGQGAQSPGFLTPWLEDPDFRNRFEWLSTVASLDLVHYGTEADADEIRRTDIAQPLLVATGLVAALGIFPHPTDAFGKVSAVAGHSVGELTAAAGARVITAEQAMVLVRERGKAMAAAAAVTATGMTAVLGGDRENVLAVIEKHGLTAANDNGPGQVVAAGTMEQLQALADEPPEKARLMPLSVAGAFHTHHMEPAVAHLGSLARSVSMHDPRTRFVSNRDGQVIHDGRDVLRRLVGQIASPVRWDLCMDTFEDLGVTGILEMPPAGTLTGIAKRALKGVETFAFKGPELLDEARAFCDKHGEFAEIDSSPTWRMVVSPAKGTFHIAPEAADADVLSSGSPIGEVASLRDRIGVTAAHGGQVVEWLVEDGDLVSPGQPLLRLHPEGGAGMTDHRGRHRRRARPHLRHRRLPTVAGDPQQRGHRGDRLERRVDPAALGHQAAPLGHPRGDRPGHVRRRRAAGAGAGRRRRPTDRLRDRGDRQPHVPDPGHRDRDRPRARHRPGRGVRHLGRLRRLLPRRRPGARTWCAAAAPATCW